MFLLLLFFIAGIVLKRKPFSRVVQEIRGKIYCKVAPRSTNSYHKVDWFMPVMMKLLILTKAFFQYGYHAIVESSMRGKFLLFFKDKIM